MGNSLSAVYPELAADWSDRNYPLKSDAAELVHECCIFVFLCVQCVMVGVSMALPQLIFEEEIYAKYFWMSE